MSDQPLNGSCFGQSSFWSGGDLLAAGYDRLRFPRGGRLGSAQESFDIGGADTVVPTREPDGVEFAVADPSMYGADGNVQDTRDLGNSQQIFVA